MASPMARCIAMTERSQNGARLRHPDEERISRLEKADGNAHDGKQTLPRNQCLGWKQIEGWPDQRVPDARSVPPTGSHAFRDAAGKVDQAKVQLQNVSVESLPLGSFVRHAPEPAIRRPSVRERGDYEIEEAYAGEVIDSVSQSTAAFHRTQVEKKCGNRRFPAEQTDEQEADRAKQTPPDDRERSLLRCRQSW